MIPLTIPEIKRLLAALTTPPLPRWLVIHWDAWTRRHQARSRWFHKRARLARVPAYGAYAQPGTAEHAQRPAGRRTASCR